MEICAQVQASPKNCTYKVVFLLDGKGSISSATYQCLSGFWICSRMAAAAIYANEKEYSKTDLSNSWTAHPKKMFDREVSTYSLLFPLVKAQFKAVSRCVTEDDKKFFAEHLPACQ